MFTKFTVYTNIKCISNLYVHGLYNVNVSSLYTVDYMYTVDCLYTVDYMYIVGCMYTVDYMYTVD